MSNLDTSEHTSEPTSEPTSEHSIDFGGLRILYDHRVLTPRPWTVAQSEWAAELIRVAPPGPVLELCAGAGHIGLLAATLAPRRLVCVDVDPVACRFLRRNAQAAELRVDVREGPMDDVLDPDERFAVVIADPPWVPTSGVQQFPEDPVRAIDGGDDGLDLVRLCLRVIERHLLVAGSALLQVGPGDQAGKVAELLRDHEGLALAQVRELERGALVQIDRLANSRASGA